MSAFTLLRTRQPNVSFEDLAEAERIELRSDLSHTVYQPEPAQGTFSALTGNDR
jgi:hypothetical protein